MRRALFALTSVIAIAIAVIVVTWASGASTNTTEAATTGAAMSMSIPVGDTTACPAEKVSGETCVTTGAKFNVVVATTAIPAAGYIGVQAWIEFGLTGLVCKSASILWPNVAPIDPDTGLPFPIAGLPTLIDADSCAKASFQGPFIGPTISFHKGDIYSFSFTCTSSASSHTLVLEPLNGVVAGPGGSGFPGLPATGPDLLVNCVAPAMSMSVSVGQTKCPTTKVNGETCVGFNKKFDVVVSADSIPSGGYVGVQAWITFGNTGLTFKNSVATWPDCAAAGLASSTATSATRGCLTGLINPPLSSHKGTIFRFSFTCTATASQHTLVLEPIGGPNAGPSGAGYSDGNVATPAATGPNLLVNCVAPEPPGTDVTGDWGFIYSVGAPPFIGACITSYSQSGAAINSTANLDCAESGNPTVVGGVTTAAMSGLNVSGQVVFPGPVTINFSGTVSPSGDAQNGTWAQKGSASSGTYAGLRLITTSVSTTPTTVVIPPSPNTGSGASVTFNAVTTAGATQVIAGQQTGTALPQNFQLQPPGTIFNVVTTAVVTGDINVCTNYQDKNNDGFVDGTTIDETTLRLLHEEGGAFVDRTESSKNDYVINKICAIVSSLSQFALGGTTKQSFPGDSDGDGCADVRESGSDPKLGGQRNYLDLWDWYDVGGSGGPGNPDGVIDLFTDILGVIQHYSLDGTPPYDPIFDRGPSAGPNPWNMTAPDGFIDLFTDILGVIGQYSLEGCT